MHAIGIDPVLLVSVVTLLMSLAHSITLEAGPLCPGQRATVHCNITGGTVLTWLYESDQLVSIVPAIGSLPPDDPVMAGCVAFTVSLVSTTPDLVSEISFVVSSVINGMVFWFGCFRSCSKECHTAGGNWK